MKTVIITEPGSSQVLKLLDRPTPLPSKNEVLIRIKAAGVNRPDIVQRKGYYPAPAGVPPDVPGLEISGYIEECGIDVNRWKKGDKVCALLAGGGYAEFAVVHEDLCLPIPQKLSFNEAAALPECVFTVWHNVFQRGRLNSAEHFLVHGGSSGIGTTAIQLAKALGAIIYATAGSETKCKVCEDLGADLCVNYTNTDFEKTLKPFGVDVILDMIGGSYFEKNISLLKPDGRLVFINAMKGAQIEANIIEIMQKRLTITGSTLRSREISFKATLAREVEKNVWPLIDSGKFKPLIYATIPLSDAQKAHELMESSQHAGKIILVNE